METTIAVRDRTAQALAILKMKLQLRSMDDTISKLLESSGEIQSSRFGSQPKLKEFSRKDRGEFREL